MDPPLGVERFKFKQNILFIMEIEDQLSKKNNQQIAFNYDPNTFAIEFVKFY